MDSQQITVMSSKSWIEIILLDNQVKIDSVNFNQEELTEQLEKLGIETKTLYAGLCG